MGDGCQICGKLLHMINMKTYLHMGNTTFREMIVEVETLQTFLLADSLKGTSTKKEDIQSKIIKVYFNMHRMQKST